MIKRRIKDLHNFNNDKSIIKQEIVPYGAGDLSRYKHIDELTLADGVVIKATLSPVDLSTYPYEPFTEYVVTASDENRIDIIAHRVYGKASMWWAIAYASNLKDPLTLPIGTVLLIPSINTLQRFPNPLS